MESETKRPYLGDEVEIGDEVTFDLVYWYKVVNVVREHIKTSSRELVFTRLYFGKEHRPMYAWKVLDVRKKQDV